MDTGGITQPTHSLGTILEHKFLRLVSLEDCGSVRIGMTKWPSGIQNAVMGLEASSIGIHTRTSDREWRSRCVEWSLRYTAYSPVLTSLTGRGDMVTLTE